MASSFFRRALPKLILIAAVLTVGVFLSRGDGNNNVSASGNWAASTTLSLICTSGPVLCPSASATGAVADTNFTLNIAGTDTNFGSVVTMTAEGACVATTGTPCGAGPAPIIGDVVGTLSSDTNLGLTNTPCSGFLIVTFVFLNASVDNSAGNLVNGSNQWEADGGGVQSPLMKDVYVVTPDDIDNGNDITGSASAISAPSVTPANGIPAHVERYPFYLNKLFDPDGPVAEGGGPTLPVAPSSRSSGGQVVAGTSVILTLLSFAPGVLNAFSAPHPLADLDDTNLGYSSVSVLQDPTRAPVTGSITDFCAPLLVSTNIFGEARTNPCDIPGVPAGACATDIGISNPAGVILNGRVRYQNPSTVGTHYYGGLHQSLRNSDADPYENQLDTCPYATNTENPKTDAGPDTDMLDSVCDGTPAGNDLNPDGDFSAIGGAWTNPQDNCPLVANPPQTQDELTFSLLSAINPESTRRPRGGVEADGLGNECDTAEVACGAAVDDDGDTLVNDGCPSLGAAVVETACGFSSSSESDNDFDGYPNDGCIMGGASPEAGADCEDLVNDDPGDDALVNDGCPPQGGGEFGCLNSTNDDGDDNGDTLINASDSVNDGCPSSARVANGHFHTTWSLIPKCIGGVDGDSDGYCTANTPAGCTPATAPPAVGHCTAPADPNDASAPIIPETYSQFRPFPIHHAGSGTNPPASREPIQICNDGLDNDGDAVAAAYSPVVTVLDPVPGPAGITAGQTTIGYASTGDPIAAGNVIQIDTERIRVNAIDTATNSITSATRGHLATTAAFHADAAAITKVINIDLEDGAGTSGATIDDCRPPDNIFSTGDDTDGDGVRDTVEIHLGTDPLARCGRGLDPSSSTPSRAWGLDLRGETAFSADLVNVTDQATFTTGIKKLNTSPGGVGFDRRWDLRPGQTIPAAAWIGAADIAAVTSSNATPMHGVKAFGSGSVCSAHKILND